MRRLFWTLSAFMLLLTLAACSDSYDDTVATPQGRYSIDIEFRDLYQSLGGEDMLGAAISSPLQNPDGTLCQYTLNIKMCYNPDGRTEVERHYLAPLESALKTIIPTQAASSPPQVYEAFTQAYNKFAAVRPVGAPLTGAIYNSEKRRMEQYFDSLGFYIQIDDPQKTVHLLPYGVTACIQGCSQPQTNGSAIGPISPPKNVDPTSIARFGGYSLFGNPIGAPYINEEGNLEQVLDNVVIYVPTKDQTAIRLRPIATLLNQPKGVPGPERFGLKENMIFVKIQGDLGYHLWIPFDQFVKQHGGTALAGRPLNDTVYVTINGQKVPQQCFENYCLYYDAAAPESQRIKMLPLGQQYLQTRK
jgi:hypothetical protein